jgi:hypothetical protein
MMECHAAASAVIGNLLASTALSKGGSDKKA